MNFQHKNKKDKNNMTRKSLNLTLEQKYRILTKILQAQLITQGIIYAAYDLKKMFENSTFEEFHFSLQKENWLALEVPETPRNDFKPSSEDDW